MQFKLPYLYHLNPRLSPTYYNLAYYLSQEGWYKTPLSCLAHCSEKHFQFDESAAQQLEFKDLLADLTHQFCPDIMPLTFNISDSKWQLILNQLADTFYKENPLNNLVWILKPAQLNNGQQIKIFKNLDQIEAHFLSKQRLGGPHVLQHYLQQPHLIKGPTEGHKYSIRMFVVLTNYSGAFLYPKGYFNIALKPYEPSDFTNLGVHLTNEHLKDETANVIQIPTDQYYELFQPLYAQIKTIITQVIQGLKIMHPQAFICQKKRSLALFGFDFMVDAFEKVWLLEANHGPCFPISSEHNLYKSVYEGFWKACIRNFIIPLASNQEIKHMESNSFEKLPN